LYGTDPAWTTDTIPVDMTHLPFLSDFDFGDSSRFIAGGHGVTIVQLPALFQFAGYPLDSGPPCRVASK
jgi:hypothetical protein